MRYGAEANSPPARATNTDTAGAVTDDDETETPLDALEGGPNAAASGTAEDAVSADEGNGAADQPTPTHQMEDGAAPAPPPPPSNA